VKFTVGRVTYSGVPRVVCMFASQWIEGDGELVGVSDKVGVFEMVREGVAVREGEGVVEGVTDNVPV